MGFISVANPDPVSSLRTKIISLILIRSLVRIETAEIYENPLLLMRPFRKNIYSLTNKVHSDKFAVVKFLRFLDGIYCT